MIDQVSKMQPMLSPQTFDVIKEHLALKDGDDMMGIGLYKQLMAIDIRQLADLRIQLDPHKFQTFIGERLTEFGCNAAAQDVVAGGLGSRHIQKYALWTALKYWEKHGVDFSTAIDSEDEEVKSDWVHYCRLLCIALNYNENRTKHN